MFLGLVSAPLNPPFVALGAPPSTFLIKLASSAAGLSLTPPVQSWFPTA